MTGATTSGRGGVIVRAQRRFRARRRAGQRRTFRRVLTIVVVLALVVLGGWLVANSSLFSLHYITVEGTSRLSAAQVIAAADVKEGSSLLRVDTSAVARRVDLLAPVRSAVVTRKWPHGLLIRVIERTPAAVAVGPDGADLLDSTGVAFAPVAEPPSGMLQVDVTAAVPGPGAAAAQAGMQVLAELPARLKHSVESIDAPSPDNISVHLLDGQVVVWGSPDDAATKAAVLQVLLRHSAHVYDVSTPSVAVTRN